MFHVSWRRRATIVHTQTKQATGFIRANRHFRQCYEKRLSLNRAGTDDRA